MKKYTTILIILLLTSCAAHKKVVEVPINNQTIIEYRDTTIFLRDTIYVPIPNEEKEIVTKRDSSHLETSVAYSDAWIDEDNNLNHKLRNKQTNLKSKIDTCFVVEYVDRFTEKEVAVEVPVEVPYIPNYAWFCIIFTCCWIVWQIAKLIWKFKGLK